MKFKNTLIFKIINYNDFTGLTSKGLLTKKPNTMDKSKNIKVAALGAGNPLSVKHAVANSASNQVEIVKQRLHYHFAKTDGTWDIPKDMPFMKEFLNEVKKLCDIVS